MIRTYTALNNQTIYDICLMTYGTLDKLFKLIGDNNFGSINNYPQHGQRFQWDDTLVFNQQVSISNSQTNVNYATAFNNTGNIGFNYHSNGLPVNIAPVIAPGSTVTIVDQFGTVIAVIQAPGTYSVLRFDTVDTGHAVQSNQEIIIRAT